MSTDIELSESLQRTDSFCTPDLHSELFTLFEHKNLCKFEEILEQGVCDKSIDINHWYGDPYYGTLLDFCCRSSNNYQFVKILLTYGAQPNRINRIRKKGPIHFAVEYADYVTVKSLLEDSRTDVNFPDNTGNSALHIAAKLNKIDIIDLLLQSPQIDINQINKKGQTALHVAVAENNKGIIVTLIKRSDIDLDQIKTVSEKTGRELIMEKYPELQKEMKLNEMSSDNMDRAKKLFSHLYHRDIRSFLTDSALNKCDLNSHDGGHSYLQYACDFGLSDVVQYLLDKGMNPNNCCPSNKITPIMIAAYRGYINIVRSLVENNSISYEPVNGETVLHSVINGLSFSKDVLGASDEEKNYYEVLKCFLTKIGRNQININEKDLKGNTALHYASKLGNNEIILLLLRHGAYIGEQNILGEPALVNIPYKVFKMYLDECVTTNDKLPREDNYEIIFKYNFLVPSKKVVPDFKRKNSPVSVETQNDFQILPHLKCETAPLLFMSKLQETRSLLKHPVLMSFVNLKWYTIRKYFYLNVIFYLLFWSLLTYYILNIYSNVKFDANLLANSSDTTSMNHKETSKFEYILWSVTLFLLGILILRELFQFVVSPFKYVISFENWIEIGLIIVSSIILCHNPTYDTRQISAIAILLSWTELVLLIGRHPLLSTNIEMFKTVCYNFLKFLAWYSIFILAFALSFYMMFKDDKSSDDENYFQNPAISIFKSVVMTTGEFDASSIPFQAHPGTSHVLFILFVFLIAIVLFNLLNGLAVSDTQTIRSNAELVSYISRINLISYFESMMTRKNIPSTDTMFSTLRCCCIPVKPRVYKPDPNSFYERINLFPYFLSNNEVHVLPNQESRVIILNPKTQKEHNDPSDSCIGGCRSWHIDPLIIKSAKEIIENRNSEDFELKNVNLLNGYKSQLEKYKQQLKITKKESEENKQMLKEILSILHTTRG